MRPLAQVCVSALIVLLVALAPAPAAAARRRALLVSSDTQWSRDPPLTYVGEDVRKLGEVLTKLGGFTQEDIVFLSNPTAGGLREQLGALQQELNTTFEDTLFVFYFSGHSDREFLHLEGEPRFSFRELFRHLNELPATLKVGILDACRSGAIMQRKAGKPARSEASGFAVTKTPKAAKGLALLFSSGEDELSREVPHLSGSLFTHHLVNGLSGAADRNGDFIVSFEEAYEYSRSLTLWESRGEQTPGYTNLVEGQQVIQLTHLRRSSAYLLFPRDWLRCLVMDSKEKVLLADIHPVPRDSRLAVPEGSYLLKCLEGSRVRMMPLDVRQGELVEVQHLRLRDEGLVSKEWRLKGYVPPPPGPWRHERSWELEALSESRSSRARVLLPILSGGALVSGGVFYGLALRERARLRREAPLLMNPEDLQRSVSRGQDYQALGFGLMGAGVLGLSMAVGLHVLGGPQAPVAVTVGTEKTSAFVQGVWP